MLFHSSTASNLLVGHTIFEALCKYVKGTWRYLMWIAVREIALGPQKVVSVFLHTQQINLIILSINQLIHFTGKILFHY